MDSIIEDLRVTLRHTESNKLADAIVNAPFVHTLDMVMLGLGIVVLLVADKSDGQIHRIALSSTEMAEGTKVMSSKRFEDIKIPIGYAKNIIAQAITTQQPHMTSDWKNLFAPALSAEEARFNQAGGAIACSFVYPLVFDGRDGALIFSYYLYPSKIGARQREFMAAYVQIVSELPDNAGHQ